MVKLRNLPLTIHLHMLNNNTIDWHSKKKSTVETSTYGSEYSSSRTFVSQIIDLRITLWYIGFPIRKLSCMFGDNDSVVNSSMIPQGKIHKWHVALSFHRIRESIAANVVFYQFISGNINPEDILSKHWAHHCAWTTLKPLLF